MDQRERYSDDQEATRAALDGRQAKMWTALPGIIQSFNATAMTVVVQTAIQAKQSLSDGSTKLVTLPLCLDCPVQFPAAGGASLTFPIAQGDECLLVFSSRCIDSWWQSGGVQPPAEARMHDLSDGFALLGFRSQPRVLSDVSASATQLRSDDGSTSISLDPNAQTIDITAPGGVTINGVTISSAGLVTSPEDVVAGSDNISLVNHVHGGVQSGPDDTDPPS